MPPPPDAAAVQYQPAGAEQPQWKAGAAGGARGGYSGGAAGAGAPDLPLKTHLRHTGDAPASKNTIKRATQGAKDVAGLLSGKGRDTGKKGRENWASDTAAACGACSSAFSLTRRRHHCRKCGGVFCSGCCSHYAAFTPESRQGEQGYSEKKKRLCGACFVAVQQQQAAHGEKISQAREQIAASEQKRTELRSELRRQETMLASFEEEDSPPGGVESSGDSAPGAAAAPLSPASPTSPTKQDVSRIRDELQQRETMIAELQNQLNVLTAEVPFGDTVADDGSDSEGEAADPAEVARRVARQEQKLEQERRDIKNTEKEYKLKWRSIEERERELREREEALERRMAAASGGAAPAAPAAAPAAKEHAGMWREEGETVFEFYCSTAEEEEGPHCTHAGVGDVCDPHWSCCGGLKKDAPCTAE